MDMKGNLRRLYSNLNLTLRKFRNRDVYQNIVDFEKSSDLIAGLINTDKPFMLTRFGATEMLCMGSYFRGNYSPNTIACMINNSGFFPGEPEKIDQFCELYLNSSRLIDVLGIWFLPEEARVIRKNCPNAHLVYLESLEPYVHIKPWSACLEGKRVLVIHPFASTIRKNYCKSRKLLFKDKYILPKFELICMRSVQSLAGNTAGFMDWFDAYDHMRHEIDKIDFDVSILGCGAYGLPLAAHIKSKGKQAIHLGGSTQLLFGIKGKRWDNMPEYSALYNEHWTRPLLEDFPENYAQPGGYWNYW